MGRTNSDRVYGRRKIGATLDRNGLRPSRYYVTKDDYIVMSSEVGVLDFPPESIVKKTGSILVSCCLLI